MEDALVQHVNVSHVMATHPTSNVTSPDVTNSSDVAPFDLSASPMYVMTNRLQIVLIPFICVLGIVGNVLAARTFCHPGLNKTSCCFYLACKCLNDTGFLLALFVVWLSQLRVSLFATPGVCQVTIFLTYLCGCLSVWLVVGITAENFIRLTRPGQVARWCRVSVARWLVGAAVVLSALCYNFSLWTTGVTRDQNGTRHCTSLPQYRSVVVATTMIDTALTLIVPSVLMFILITAIVLTSMEAFRRKKRLHSAAASQRVLQNKRLTPEGKMTTFLFALSVIFLCLNLPTHTIRLKLLIQVYIHQDHPSNVNFILQRLFEVLLYFNFSTNFFIYMLFGERFRAVFQSSCCWRLKDKVQETGASATGVTPESPILLNNRHDLTQAEDSVYLSCVPESNEVSSV